jgi:hypothetical protein
MDIKRKNLFKEFYQQSHIFTKSFSIFKIILMIKQSTNKVQKGKIVSYCIFLILLNACEHDKINIPDTGRKIVINGLITTDSLLNVRISKSYYYNSNQTSIELDSLNNARVLFYSGNTYIDSLHFANKSHQQISTDFFYRSNYWSDKIYPEPGKEYEILVRAPGYPDASAKITVPNPVKIASLDTSRFLVPSGSYSTDSDIMYKCKISFSDLSYETNFYMLKVSKVTYREWWNDTADFRLISEDPLIEVKLTNFNGIYAYAFSDRLINGENCNLQFNINAREIGMPFYESAWQGSGVPIAFYKTVVYFRLYSIPEEYFLYLKSLDLYNKNYGKTLAEPVIIYSNVEGGYGIFGAATVSCDSLVFLPKN